MTDNSTPSGKRPVFSASTILAAVGADLALIKAQDGLTYADLAAVLGKSEDQAAKYCEGSAEMGLVAFGRGWREWNGRFAGSLANLCHDSRPPMLSDQVRQSKVIAAALALAKALEDGEVTPDEVKADRATFEGARDALDELLRKVVRAA